MLITDRGFAQTDSNINKRNSLLNLEQETNQNIKKFKALQKKMDSTQKIYYDSLKEVIVQKDIQQNIKNLDEFVADQKEKEKGEEKSLWLRAGLFLAAMAGLMIHKFIKKKKE